MVALSTRSACKRIHCRSGANAAQDAGFNIRLILKFPRPIGVGGEAMRNSLSVSCSDRNSLGHRRLTVRTACIYDNLRSGS